MARTARIARSYALEFVILAWSVLNLLLPALLPRTETAQVVAFASSMIALLLAAGQAGGAIHDSFVRLLAVVSVAFNVAAVTVLFSLAISAVC